MIRWSLDAPASSGLRAAYRNKYVQEDLLMFFYGEARDVIQKSTPFDLELDKT
jgi:hypothetical protein